MKKGSKKAVNKNAVILIISALLIVVSVAIAFFAIKDTDFLKKKQPEQTTPLEITDDFDKAPADGQSPTKKAENAKAENTTGETDEAPAATESSNEAKPYVFAPGKYKIATKDDPLGLRLEPSADSDRLIYIPKGETVEVLVVSEDWGYVVYNHTGGWLSMNYLEAVGSTTATNAEE